MYLHWKQTITLNTFTATIGGWPHLPGGRGNELLVMSSRLVSLKAHHVRERCTLNLSRAQTSSRRCGGIVKGGGTSSGVFLVT
ncbi:hypothetical protein TNCV_287741 [Trichonephila clavipes]|nr:hypothetical protein TNCV_287741 [Trichonephila clavipes]